MACDTARSIGGLGRTAAAPSGARWTGAGRPPPRQRDHLV